MKRQTPLSAAHRHRTRSTTARCWGIISFFHLIHSITCPRVDLSLFHPCNTRYFNPSIHSAHPHCTAALILPPTATNDFLYLTPSQIWVRNPTSLGEVGWGGGAQITWPLYLIFLLTTGSSSSSLQTAPWNLHHSSAAKPHKRWGGLLDVCLCRRRTQAAHAVPAVEWRRRAVRALSSSLDFLTFSPPVPLAPTARRLFPSRPLPLTSQLQSALWQPQHWRRSINPELTHRTTRCFDWTGFSFLCESRWKQITEVWVQGYHVGLVFYHHPDILLISLKEYSRPPTVL